MKNILTQEIVIPLKHRRKEHEKETLFVVYTFKQIQRSK